MDLNLIKQRLESLNKQSNNSGGERKNLFWKPNKPIDIGFLNTGLYFLNVGNTVLQFYKE